MKSDIGMRKTTIYLLPIVIMLLSACSERLERLDDDSTFISLCASVNDAAIDTRAASQAKPFRGTVATDEYPLDAKVLFSTEKGVYRHSPVSPTYLPCHSKVTFVDDTYKYPEKYNGFNLKYPIDNSTVYCVGMSPADGEWVISDDGKYATHPIDGNDDLMFAACEEGTWSDHFEPHLYKHQLTWLKLCVYATDPDAEAFWGKIESLSVKSKAGIVMSLDDGSATFDTTIRLISAYEGDYQLTTTLCEIGSIFCSPEVEYDITVNTKKYGERTISVKLKDLQGNNLQSADEAVGNLYVIELGFTPFAIIEGNCVLNPWNYQDENLYLK